ncbi:MAG: DUF1553 domain-containing protein, partial [Pirellulaceae bacterium]|nr:DUF1553 domain-containing protein [Pirellulaceae bacterium]
PPADMLVVARRLSLALTGTIPSLEELRQLEKQPAESQLDWWLDHLLEDRRFADHVAERLARSYVGADGGPFLVFRRRRFVLWLSDQLAENKPYDELAQELIVSEGLWTSSPATNYFTVTITEDADGKPDPSRMAGRTARAFLGVRIDCLQCHDDNMGNVDLGEPGSPRGGLQQDFHQFAAFFNDARVSGHGLTDEETEYNYRYLGADEEQLVEPDTPFFDHLLPEEGDNRERLAAWLTHPENRPFARIAVNRVWAILCGLPLSQPIDDIPLHDDMPPGMDILADDFVANGYDLRRLIRTIASLDVYQKDSRAPFEITRRHEDSWAVFPLTRLRPEQVAGAVIQASSLETIDARTHFLFRLTRYTQQNEFVKRHGDIGEDEFEQRAGTVPQRLQMMNGKLVAAKTKAELFNASNRIATLAASDKQAVETAFLAVLSRRPADSEYEHFIDDLGGVKGNLRSQRLEDLFWTLINCTEFSWNH